ncbi:LLM class flavin-dependent oxidoreductase [Sphingobium fuliginis ATCC 27551]|uniref:LLM class flavin-dependent oxidoreductase n=2 Tax=Sphingobium fuliginis (strain ATCC 27551) TaxID=336203 RepID=A0A5B8CLZ0_SPHSA|nr:LLM class flavin-dependent oxidoreductase [Sphingobium fuliginis ATCC 27551]
MIHLAAFLFTPSGMYDGWRHSAAQASADMDFDLIVDVTRAAERGKFDAIFFADTVAMVGNANPETMATGQSRQARLCYLEPASLITALAPMTSNIGLIATMTTTYNEPYHVARRMASIDHISKGRAGWNLVTSQIEEEAWNFGLEQHVAHADRYERAAEFSEVVKGLWDSWEEDAHVRDKVTGQVFDPQKVHILGHKGPHFSVRGPLNVARPPQGHPIIAQAGSSEPGKELAARTADLVFTAQRTVEESRTFYQDLKGRMAMYGRDESSLHIMPGVVPIAAETDEEAQAILDEIESFMTVEQAIKAIQRHAGDLDLTQFDPEGPLPPLPPVNTARGRQQVLIDMAERDNLNLGQVARRFAASAGHRILVGSPKTIADSFEAWHMAGAADGFVLIFPFFPTPVYNFVDLVVPELQRRGLFRKEYESAILRENLGFERPANRFHRQSEPASVAL